MTTSLESTFACRSRRLLVCLIEVGILFGLGTTSVDAVSRAQARIARKFNAFGGEAGVYAEDLLSSKRLSVNAAMPYYLSSVVKLLVMIEVHRQVHAGRLSFEKTVTITKDTRRDGSVVLNYVPLGQHVTVARLLELMMIRSDNGATDQLIELVGVESLNRTIRQLGYDGKKGVIPMDEVRRRIWARLNPKAWQLSPLDFVEMWHQKRFAKKIEVFADKVGVPKQRYTSARLIEAYNQFFTEGYNTAHLQAIVSILKKLWNGELVSRRMSVRMLNLMRQCKTGEKRLKAGFPRGTLFFQKTGTQFQNACNVGIAYRSRRAAFVVAMCARKFSGQRKVESLMKSIGQELSREFGLR